MIAMVSAAMARRLSRTLLSWPPGRGGGTQFFRRRLEPIGHALPAPLVEKLIAVRLQQAFPD